jgi:hypothetical protein
VSESAADGGRGLFVHAVVRAEHPLPDGATGVGGSPLALVPYDDVAAVVSEVDLDAGPGRRADLDAYAAVMEALLSGGPVAPIRFGSVLLDADAVVDEVLAPDAEQLAALLDELDGCVQYNVRATYVEEAVLAELVRDDPEIRELRERTRDLPEDARVGDRIRLGELVAQSWQHLAQADADHILGRIAPAVAAHAVRRDPGPAAALDAALLVEVERAEELEDSLEDLAAQAHGRMELRLVGPLAPYDFVGAT